MTRRTDRLLSVILLICGVGVGLYYFGTGFLLARVELEARSSCLSPPVASRSSCHTSSSAAEADETDLRQLGCCWTQRRFKRAVLLVVDALRFDFVWSNMNKTAIHQHSSAPAFMGKMPVFAEMAAMQDRATWFFEAWADAPTTTMQRLKGLTTGGLPTFLDVGSSFATTALTEDNLLTQLTAGGRATIIGDDTWKALFPTQFARDFSLPSFDVKDLHSVDAAVARRLPEELKRDDWELIVAHTLGVDHVGHRHGSDHPVMAAKLAEMDKLIRTVISALPEDTLLVVLGDHGMTPDGNHGGASDHELSSALVLHYHEQNSSREARMEAVKTALGFSGRSSSLHGYRRVMQVDLVPTLALLLGLPVPFGNVGMAIPEPFLQATNAEAVTEAARLTAWQTRRYLEAYSKLVPGFGGRPEILQARAILRDADKLPADAAATREYYRAHDSMARACRAAWATFDTQRMLWGVLTVVTFAIALAMLVFAAPFGIDEFPLKGVLYGALGGLVSAVITRKSQRLTFPFASACVGSAVGFASSVWGWIRLSFRAKRVPWPLLFPFAIIVLRCAGLFSNSFIEADSRVVSFLLCSVVVVLAMMFVPNGHLLPRTIWLELAGIALVSRLSLVHGDNYGRHEAHSDYPAVELGFFTLIPSLLLVFAGRVFVWQRRSLSRVFFELSVGVACMFWTAQNPISASLTWAPSSSMLFARASFALAGCSLLTALVFAKQQSYAAVVAPIAVIVALVSGPRAPLSVLLLFFQGLMTSDVINAVSSTWGSVLAGVVWGLTGTQYFYATGHTCLFSGIHFEAAFVGLQNAHIVLGGVLVALNTIGMPLLAALSLPLFTPRSSSPNKAPRWHWLFCATIALLLFYVATCASTTTFVHFARRHLMVWRVFCPRLLFDAALLAASSLGLSLGWIVLGCFNFQW